MNVNECNFLDSGSPLCHKRVPGTSTVLYVTGTYLFTFAHKDKTETEFATVEIRLNYKKRTYRTGYWYLHKFF